MKRSVITFSFIVLALQVFSQSSDSWLFGVSGYVSYNEFGTRNLNPSIVANYKKHTFFLGPLLANKIEISSNKYFPGLQLGYQIYPNGKGKVFSFFFEYDLNYLSAKINTDQATFIINNTSYQAVRTIDMLYISNYVSYGFNIHFLKHLYISFSAGLGANWSKKAFIWKTTTGQTLNFDGDRLRFNYINSLLKLGVGCNLVSLKSKHIEKDYW